MKFYNLHTHHYTNNPDMVELVNQYPWEFNDSVPRYSIGIHPWHIDENRLETDLKIMEEKLSLAECLAVGECGLDKRIEVPMGLQLKVFERQIALAEQFNKPLVLHLVAAYDELIALHKRLNIKVPVVLHGFSKNAQVAKQLLDNGFYLSFGKYLLQNPELKTTFLSMPNDRFLLETDMIAETLEEVYAKAAEYKGMTIEDLKAIVSNTWNAIF